MNFVQIVASMAFDISLKEGDTGLKSRFYNFEILYKLNNFIF